jgi:4-hydroxybenzoate polyprenyltransferase
LLFDTEHIRTSVYLRVLNKLTYGGYITALVGPGLVLTTCIISNWVITLPLLLISYLVVLLSYSYDYYSDLVKEILIKPTKVLEVQKDCHYKYFKFIFLFYNLLLGFTIFVTSNLKIILFVSLITFSGLIYGKLLKKFTKKIPLFKNIYVSLLISLFSAFLPCLYYNLYISMSFMLIFLFIYLRVILNTIFFDLKDVFFDTEKGLKTLPVLIGKTRTINYLHYLNIISFIPLIFGFYLKIFSLSALTLLFFVFYTFYYLNKSKNTFEHNEMIILALIADLEFILWLILILSCKMIENYIRLGVLFF